MEHRRRAGLAVAVLAACVALLPATGAAAAPAGPATDPVVTARVPMAPTDDQGESTAEKRLRFGALLQGWRIGLDPGHNGGNATALAETSRQVADGRGGRKPCNTTGTTSLTGYPEHAFTFDVSQRLKTRLERLGAEVVLTRTDDDGVGPCVDVRGRFAEDADVDLMLSLHANGSTDRNATGFFAIVAHPAISPSQEEPSLELAHAMIDALAAGGFTPSSTVPDALSERDDLATLNFARRPAVMLELGEMRNPAESELMGTPEGRQAYADALVAGVLAWTNDNQPG